MQRHPFCRVVRTIEITSINTACSPLQIDERELLSGDRGAFQNGSARTRSYADAAHMRKASDIMQMRQTRQMQIDEDACTRN